MRRMLNVECGVRNDRLETEKGPPVPNPSDGAACRRSDHREILLDKWLRHAISLFRIPHSTFRTWLRSSHGDMVWNALVLITVLLPLASLTIDVPRYYVLKVRLQLAADATAEMTAQCVDFPHFQNTGETRLDSQCWWSQAHNLFAATVQPLESKGYQPRLDQIAVDEQNDIVRVDASGSTRLFFGVTPAVRVQVTAQSKFRMEMR